MMHGIKIGLFIPMQNKSGMETFNTSKQKNIYADIQQALLVAVAINGAVNVT
jgi:hypothetical protein